MGCFALARIAGGTSFAARNVISGSGGGQVELLTTDSGPNVAAANNRIQGNYLGTQKNGTVGIGGAYGVLIQSSSNNAGGGVTGTLIGGSGPGAGNLMSGLGTGVYLQLDGALNAKTKSVFVC